jgi:hypothetical protein
MKNIPHEVMQELQKYAMENGRNWRSKLSLEWTQGSETLRWIRNAIGPTGLYALKITKAKP